MRTRNVSFGLGLGRYGQQTIQYIFVTDLANTIHIRYNKHYTYGFKIKHFGFQQQRECFEFIIYIVNPTNTSAKVK